MEFEYSTSGDPVAGLVGGIVGAVLGLILLIAIWKIFTKAGRPGWHAIIPILNTYQLIKIGSQPGWFVILMFIPVVNLIIYIITALGIAKNFAKSGAFGLFGLVVFSFIGFPVLGFGSSKFVGAQA
jgi:hypothetical protein